LRSCNDARHWAAIETRFRGFVVLGGGTVAAWRQQIGINGIGRGPCGIYVLEESIAYLVLSYGESCAKYEYCEQE
jgi:hypothetical protein